jgi:hypothetical protein
VRSRVAVSAILAAGVLLGSSGCAFFSPVATQLHYDPSDGTSTTVGDIKVRNAIAITEDGETVNLVMAVINSGDETAIVRFQYGFEGTEPTDTDLGIVVPLEAGETISFGNGGESTDAILEDAGVELGGLMPVFVQYGEETGKTMLVPVLDGSLPGYEDLVPTTVPTASATPEPTGTETPTATPTPTAAP